MVDQEISELWVALTNAGGRREDCAHAHVEPDCFWPLAADVPEHRVPQDAEQAAQMVTRLKARSL